MSREELIARDTCIACQKAPVVQYSLYCRNCGRTVSNADWRATGDAVREVRVEYCTLGRQEYR